MTASARALLLTLAAALLGGCPHHVVKISTKVGPDGSFERTLVFREEEENDVWKFFAPPRPPYVLSGTPEKGMTAEAKLEPGTHASGIRLWLRPDTDLSEEQKLQRPTVEGTVSVAVDDLLLGKLYRYEERPDIGVDPVHFRRQLGRWLDLGGELFFQALSKRFPQHDLRPLARHWKEDLNPRLHASLLRIQLAGQGLMREWRSGVVLREEDLLRSPFAKTIVAELVEWELVPDAEPETLQKLGEAMEKKEFWMQWLERRLAPGLAPLSEEARRDLLALLRNPDDDAMNAAMEEVAAERWKTEEAEKRVQEESMRFLVSAAGVGIMAMFEDIDVETSLEMPGIPLRSNVHLLEPGKLVWRMGDEHFWVVGPLLHASSFAPQAWAAKEANAHGQGWSIERIAALAKKLRALPPETRKNVRAVCRIAEEAGLEKAEAAARGLDEADRDTWKLLVRFLRGESLGTLSFPEEPAGD